MTKEDVKVTAGAPPYRPSLRIVAQSLEICERFGITTYVDVRLHQSLIRLPPKRDRRITIALVRLP
jgi:hypothetical protein